MSTRALRRAQRELEEKKRREEAEAESESEDEQLSATAPKTSVFALLDNPEEPEEEEDDEAEQSRLSSNGDSNRPSTDLPSSTTAKRKKRKKGKGVKKPEPDSKSSAAAKELDEIDAALRSLSTSGTPKTGAEPSTGTTQDLAIHEISTLLSIDTQNLHAANEMRRLFGRAALEADHEEPEAAGGRRRGRRAQQVGLAGAVAGRHMPGDRRGLASLGLRRNIFIQGKEEWPRATGGGLGMEVVEKRPDGTVEYRFVHNNAYQDVQRQFQACVASMDPERMIHLLQFNPYHISTLLQVSEIAKQERDHATSGDLLERALFSFGRSVHSTFSSNLQRGLARMDFRRPENREFWLAVWRYMGNLGMRATWRTVFEWAKLLLSLDPEGDHYCVSLVLDQFASRARQYQQFIDIAESRFFKSRWSTLPNVRYTTGLAHIQAGKPKEGRKHLKSAIEDYPWVAARLFQELNIEPIPPSIWGKQPRTDYEKLMTELYVVRGKDLWNTPEATSVLVEVASATDPPFASFSQLADFTITRDQARHTLLTDNPALIGLIPRELTSRIGSSSDPLPPEDSQSSYDVRPRVSNDRPNAEPVTRDQRNALLERLMRLFGAHGGLAADPATEDILAEAQEAGLDPELVQQIRRELVPGGFPDVEWALDEEDEGQRDDAPPGPTVEDADDSG